MKCKVCFYRDSRIDGMCNECWHSFLAENKKTGIGKSRWVVQNAKHHSLIFTNAELESIEERKKGNKEDVTGIFAGRVKPKIKEIFKLFDSRKELLKLIPPSAPSRRV